MTTLYMLVGIPCSGKSFYAKQYSEETGTEIVCPDEIRVSFKVSVDWAFSSAREEVDRNLRSGKDVIFDATNIMRKMRQSFIEIAKNYKSEVVCWYMKTPTKLCLERQKKVENQGIKINPSYMTEKLAEQLVNNQPALGEGFKKICVYAGVGFSVNSGKLNGKIRLFLDQIDPMQVLKSYASHGVHWELDYTLATRYEAIQWMRAEVVARAILARMENRSIFLDGKEFTSSEDWETMIMSSDKIITKEKDDESGFWAKTIN